MKLTKKQYQKIEHLMPISRKPPKISNYQFLCALLYIIENGCKWRALPKKYGKWHTIYMKFNRWSKNGTIQKIFEEMQNLNIIDIRTDTLCIDSTSIKVHPDAAGVRKSNGKQSIGRSKGGLTTKLHLCCASERYAFVFHLSAGNCHDAPQGRKLIETIYSEDNHALLMDRAYEDNKTRALAEEHGFYVVVPPKKNRKDPWEYDKELYKERNQIERYFLRIKRFRKVFTRYDKLDSIFLSVIMLAMIFDALFM